MLDPLLICCRVWVWGSCGNSGPWRRRGCTESGQSICKAWYPSSGSWRNSESCWYLGFCPSQLWIPWVIKFNFWIHTLGEFWLLRPDLRCKYTLNWASRKINCSVIKVYIGQFPHRLVVTLLINSQQENPTSFSITDSKDGGRRFQLNGSFNGRCAHRLRGKGRGRQPFKSESNYQDVGRDVVKELHEIAFLTTFMLMLFLIRQNIVNRGKWLGSLAKFFVLCFCSLFWPWPCTNTIGHD